MAYESWNVMDPGGMEGQEVYHLINAIVVPRPIAWVSTVSATGVSNIAPHSYFTLLSPSPPMLCFSSTGEKDTIQNVRHTRDFVVNMVPEALAEEMNFTAADFPPNESEFEAAGLTAIASDLVQAPRLAESPASMECVLENEFPLGDGPSNIVIGRVVRIHVASDVLGENGRIDLSRIRPVGRLSGSGYSRTSEFFSMPRPTYADVVRLREAQGEATGPGN